MKEGINTFWMNGAKTGQRCGAIRQCEIERVSRDCICIGTVAELGFFRKGVGIEPINQLLSPTRDNPRLGIMHVGVNKTRVDQCIRIIHNRGIRVRRFQRQAVTHCHNAITGN